jgi:hypothetical protein
MPGLLHSWRWYLKLCRDDNNWSPHYCNNLLPLSFRNLWPTNAERGNQENTPAFNRNLRDDNLLHVPFSRLEHYRKFPLAEFPRIWNDIITRNNLISPSRNVFKNSLKEHLLANLSESVTCNRLLCPVCHLGQ